jgi:hypothetical protein
MAETGHYQIQVRGWLSNRLAVWFHGASMTRERDRDGAPVTLIAVTVLDQAALRGILATIWDLNLVLLSVTRSNTKGAESDE